MGQLDIAVLILQHIRARALQNACESCREPRRMPAGRQRFAAGFDADQADRRVFDERVEYASALLPPPTHATIASGRRPVSFWN